MCPLFTSWSPAELISAIFFSCNPMMRNVHFYSENHIIDTTGGGWLVRKYRLQPPTPPYLRERLVRVNRLVPPVSPCLSSDLSNAANRLDELLLHASPARLSSIASKVVAELNDLVPPRPKPGTTIRASCTTAATTTSSARGTRC